jgi:serine/threonine-protein kinase HipA
MGRRPRYAPLQVLMNNRRVGTLSREASGAIMFTYHDEWLAWAPAFPVSLSLPLREQAYRGEPVVAVFENLLPDSDALRRAVAERVGARGIDAYNLLSVIGHDCVGALQFATEVEEVPDAGGSIEGEPVDDGAIEQILKGLGRAPLGLGRDDPFRISVAGAQEKTALLWHEDRWIKPHGTTPTTHILKPQIGHHPSGIDLSDSVENEYYCLKLVEAFGLPVNFVDMQTFGETKTLIVERFDRRWTKDGRLIRLPQEDLCQALSVPPTLKYQSEGGPGIVDILKFFIGSDTPIADQDMFVKAQIIFWLMGATDGHAKNFSIFLRPGGGFAMTPLYDILSAEPSFQAGQLRLAQMKLAMSVGTNRHYRVDQVHGRHFVQTGDQAGLSKSRVLALLEEIHNLVPAALDKVTEALPEGFPEYLHETISKGVLSRRNGLQGIDAADV